jgi:NCAIR mutase (PurE)-related protein
MNERRLRSWIRDVRAGKRKSGALVEQLARMPYEDLGFARLDTHRHLRRGLPEAVFCEGKQPQQVITITRRLARSQDVVILTRLESAVYPSIRSAIPSLAYDPLARIGYLVAPGTRPARRGFVAVVSGGTADLPIAEEAAKTLELLGSRTVKLYDVGVAGLHRLLGHWAVFRRARAIVVAAGMEGALASVVAGLVACPVVAVPTSVGYGASFQGLAALLTMLNSCAPGVGVVNIDNGFGAAYLAHLINCPARGNR